MMTSLKESTSSRWNWLRSRLRRLLTHDFFPQLSARLRRRLYTPLGVLLLAAVASLLCGLFLHPQGFVLLGAVLAVVALGLAWPWLSLRALDGSLAFERAQIQEGESVEVR